MDLLNDQGGELLVQDSRNLKDPKNGTPKKGFIGVI